MLDKNKILIIESSEIIRNGLSRIIKNSFPGFDILLHSHPDELRTLSENHTVSLIFINASFIENLRLRKDLFERIPEAPLIGIITQSFPRDDRFLFEDVLYISDSLDTITGMVKKALHRPAKKKNQSEKLTDREHEVLKQLIRGYSNKQIADELFISIHTVITHRKNISAKLGIKSLAGLTIYGVINDIIDVNDYLDSPE